MRRRDTNGRRSGFTVMMRLVGLVRPLSGYMALAIVLGLAGHLCATAITVFGGYGVLGVLDGALRSASGGMGAAGAVAVVSPAGAAGTAMAAATTATGTAVGEIPLAVLTTLPLTGLFIAMGVAAVLRGALRYGEQACNHFIAFTLLALIRDQVFRALRHLAPAKLERRDRGDLISVITSDIELLEVFYAHTISPVVIAMVFSLLLTVYIGSFHVVLGAVALAAYVTVGVAVPLLVSRASGDAGLRFRSASGALSGFILDSLRGLDEIMQYGCGAERLGELGGRDAALARDEWALKCVGGRNVAGTNTVILAFDLLMLACASGLYLSGVLTFPSVVLPVLALMGSFGPVVALANLGSTLQGTFAAGNRVLDILDEEPVTADVHGCAPVAFTGAEARAVSFAYDEAASASGDVKVGVGTHVSEQTPNPVQASGLAAAAGPAQAPARDHAPAQTPAREHTPAQAPLVLEDVSLSIDAGEIVGVTGRSGSGKSTLLRLFMRFWDVQHGAVEVSGVDVGRINTDNLRALEAFMEQDTHLFHDTIRNNVKIAKLDATDAEVEEACRKASVHEFICSLPDGYDTQVGELGDTLSGGERQRLGLARAFLHDAPFMLLDEPTSNLDSLNEGVILRALRASRENKAVLLVSHRASTMRVADRVVHIERGRAS